MNKEKIINNKPLPKLPILILPYFLAVYIGVGVAAGIVLIIVVLVVAYFVMKSKK